MYYLAINRVQSGPFSEAEVRQRAARGEFGPADLCWQDGWPQWRRIGEVFPPAVPPVLPAVPPALPPVAGGTVAAAAGLGHDRPATSGQAIGSLICGIGVWVLWPFFFLLAPAAVILGHLAKARIKRSAGRLAGVGLATAGLLLGYIGGGLILAAGSTVTFFIVREYRHDAQEVEVRERLEKFWTAADQQLRDSEAAEVGYAQIVGVGKALEESALEPVAGESYRELVVVKGDESLSVTLGDGREVTYYAGEPAGGLSVTEAAEPATREPEESAAEMPAEEAPATRPESAPEPEAATEPAG